MPTTITQMENACNPGLIVWPETSLPFFYQDNLELSPMVDALSRESGAPLVFGSPAYSRIDGRVTYYNRAYLITPEGSPPQYYDKVHLVPFGEYVPFKDLLFFVNRLVPAAGDFQPGGEVFPLKRGTLSLGTLICFEAIFPELARTHARQGATILINLTNDAWFGRTSAPYQHLSMAVLRAVENRIPLIRAANTGISAFVDHRGAIRARSELFNEQILTQALELPPPSPTFYTRFGDLFALSTLVLALLLSIGSFKGKERLRRLGS